MNAQHLLPDLLPNLISAADDAYQVVRLEVIDRLPRFAVLDATTLSTRQRYVLDRLRVAEADLADFRDQSYRARDSSLARYAS